MARGTKGRAAKTTLDRDGFLRSINIVFDAGSPERIAHFFPTEKSAALIDRLVARPGGDSCYMVAAPYGSGKSLAGAFALHVVENTKESRPIVREICGRLQAVDGELAGDLEGRIKQWSKHGLGVPLHGHCDSLPRALVLSAVASFERLDMAKSAESLREFLSNPSKTDDIVGALNQIKVAADGARIDQILILWDEFGRHLETLVREGRTAELLDLQLLAEFSSRQKALPVSLALFLHQGFLNYANGLPQSVRREWKKVEGRFITIDYVEDSKEIYRLIGDLVTCLDLADKRPPKRVFIAKAQELFEAGRFSGLGKGELVELLQNAYPLTPAALELLPRISARVSQNERTLFSFLFQLPLIDGELNADVLFDYFGEQMQADVEIGGTYRQWLETESALQKVAGDRMAEMALKITCLLGLGLSGERARPSREAAILAVAGYRERRAASEILDELVSRKLLLHRRHSDEIAVWHGTDLDLRGRLSEEKAAMESGFDLVAFLSKEAASPIWRPQEYNDEFGIRRHFSSHYLTVVQLEEYLSHSRNPLTEYAPDEDGRIYYVVPENGEEVKGATRAILGFFGQELFGDHNLRSIFVIPRESLPVRDAALEVACLISMGGDSELIGADPLVLPEIQQMLDDARSHLQRLVERLTVPGGFDLSWMYGREVYQIPSAKLLRRFLSNIMRRIYPLTPKIQSEVIVRRKPSSPVINSRKKLIMGILERGGQQHFGIEGNFPDASMCRTVLEDTGLYRLSSRDDRWSYASAHDLPDKGLAEVWLLLQDFFGAPAAEGKKPAILFNTLLAPPFGLRVALLPILFAAGMKAFAYTTNLLRDGEFIADVLPSDIELVCKEPDRHLLKVLELTVEEVRFLERVRRLFSGQQAEGGEEDLVRQANDAIHGWLRQLPGASLTTRNLSEKSLAFREEVKGTSDPVELILGKIPAVIGSTVSELARQKVFSLRIVKEEIESVVDGYRGNAILALRHALQVDDDSEVSTRTAAKKWASAFLEALPPGHSARPILMRMTMDYDSEAKFIDSIGAALGRVSIARWQDEDPVTFSSAIHDTVRGVEAALVQTDLKRLRGRRGAELIKTLIAERIREYADKLNDLVGEEEAAALVSDILASRRKS